MVLWLFCDVGVMPLKGLSKGNFRGYFMQVLYDVRVMIPRVFPRVFVGTLCKCDEISSMTEISCMDQ